MSKFTPNAICLLTALLSVLSTAGQSSTKKVPQFPPPAFGKVEVWDSALAKAKKENKWVFIDCYTDWCGWCKIMDQKNFADTQVQNKMNSFLNSYSLEMEKDDLGKLLRFHFGINGFPSFLIFNGDGDFIGSYFGYSEKGPWLNYLDSMQQLKESTTGKGKYKRPGLPPISASNIPDWFRGYILNKNFSIFEDTTSTGFVNRFKQVTDPFQQMALYSIAPYRCDETLAKQWLARESMYDSLFGHDWTKSTAYKLFGHQVQHSVEVQNEAQFQWALRELLKRSEYPEFDKPSQYMEWYKKRGEWSRYVASFDEMAAKINPSGLNSVAWEIFQSCDDTKILKKAIEYSSMSIEKTPNWAYYDTRANLYYKLGNFTAAQENASEAIRLGTAAGENISNTQALMSKINVALPKSPNKKGK
jgi:thioredoxin-related protein